LLSGRTTTDRSREIGVKRSSPPARLPVFINESKTQQDDMTNESRSKLEKSKDEVETTQEDGVVNSILEIDNDLKENLFMCIWMGFIADHRNACSVEGKIVIIIIIIIIIVTIGWLTL
jgi:hypothetical protein